MIKKPRDTHRKSFDKMMSMVPAGAVFLKSRKMLWWRDFEFLLTEPPPKPHKRGDRIMFSCVRNIQRMPLAAGM